MGKKQEQDTLSFLSQKLGTTSTSTQILHDSQLECIDGEFDKPCGTFAVYPAFLILRVTQIQLQEIYYR